MQGQSATNGHLADERREAILRMLAAEQRIVASEIGQRLGVSTDTVQRDLARLEDRGLLRRVRGGALPASPGPTAARDRAVHDVEAKVRIAGRAWEAIGTDGVVAIGGGSTTALLGAAVPGPRSITVVTASPELAGTFADVPGVEVHVVGGRLDPRSRTLVGPPAVDAFRRVRPDVVVLSACSVDVEAGVTMQHADEAAVVSAMIDGARKLVVLATAERIGTAAPFVVADATAIDVLVTDADPPRTASLAAAGVDVRFA